MGFRRFFWLMEQRATVAVRQAHPMLRLASRGLDLTVTLFGGITALLLTVVAVSIVYDASSRFAFNNPTSWAYEISINAMTAAVFLGIPYALKTQQHVRVDILLVRFPQLWRSALERISMLCVMVFAAILTWNGIALVLLSINSGQTTPQLNLPLYVVQLSIPICGVLLGGEALRFVVTGITKQDDSEGIDTPVSVDQSKSSE